MLPFETDCSAPLFVYYLVTIYSYFFYHLYLHYFDFRPENAPRLFDLIRISDERVRPAFYYGVRDTLVAKDLDQATRISYGRVRFRVVTLGGDVIEIAGQFLSFPTRARLFKNFIST